MTTNRVNDMLAFAAIFFLIGTIWLVATWQPAVDIQVPIPQINIPEITLPPIDLSQIKFPEPNSVNNTYVERIEQASRKWTSQEVARGKQQASHVVANSECFTKAVVPEWTRQKGISVNTYQDEGYYGGIVYVKGVSTEKAVRTFWVKIPEGEILSCSS